MAIFNVPSRAEVNETNKEIFDNLEKQVGFVPNLYATYALSDNALSNYLTFSGSKTSLNNKEKEVVNLAVSEVNGCTYCLAAHTAIAKSNGFTEGQILELRAGKASFQSSYDALAQLAKNITENRGKADEAVVDAFLAVGYTQENLIDTIVLVGEKTISNYIHNLTDVPVDFPTALPLKAALV
jgi:uncharacterized peroxidase-related enzyme